MKFFLILYDKEAIEMKKLQSVLLSIIMLFAFCNIASATSYRDPVDGIKMNPGLNPVVKFIEGDKYEYTLYAVEMDGITNGDFSFIYTENIVFESFKARGDFDMCITHDAGDRLNVSFINEEPDSREAFKLFTITFSYTGEPTYPKVKVTHIAGTYMKSVADVVFVNEKGDVISVEKGDVDLNGTINASDARLALRYSAQLEKLTDVQLKNGDVNGDGIVNSADARQILRFSAGLEKGFN